MTVDVLESLDTPTPEPRPTELSELRPDRPGASRRRLSWPARVALAVAIILFALALLAPLIAPYPPNVGKVSERLLGFGQQGHLLGTDGQGRDVFSRLLHGARPSLLSGLIPVAFAGVVGTLLGVVAGLGGRRQHAVIMRTLDVFYAFPAVLLAIAIAAALGSGISNAIIALSIILVPPIARVAEAETVRLREADFMEAARASGAPWVSIAGRHVLPNIGPSVVVYCTALIGLSIVYAAGLSFLGLGLTPPAPEWGLMVNDLRQFTFTRPDLAVVPALVILVASVTFNVLGDGLRDLLDVRAETVR
jgi:peptide/nickel transport system permease protein